MQELKLPKLRKVDANATKKKKILLLSDDLRMHSGIATMSKEIVLNTIQEYDWIQLGAALKHPESGKVVDVSQDVAKISGVEDAYCKIYCSDGYGNPDVIRQLIQIERPDAILHFTDPRFWGWLYGMEHELRQLMPLFYYTIWDDVPYPRYNRPYYESCDLLMCISKQTFNIVKQVLQGADYQDWQVTYVPHGINSKLYYPITEAGAEWKEFQEFKSKIVPADTEFVMFYNARNIRRKHTSDLILAYKEFCDQLPEEKRNKCLFLLHTDQVDENGTDLPAVIDELCPYPVQFTPSRLVSPKELNFFYNLADISANIASNEGFGLGTAESVMAGTPIVVNVTGGLQDQCGFKKETGEYLTEHDYTDEMPTNSVGVYKEHGEWVEPVFPAVRTLQGSIPTPYIFDDIACYKDVAAAIMKWYQLSHEERKSKGLRGREYFLSEQSGLSAENMGKRFIKDMTTAFANWKPRKRTELVKI
jgi:glycosyltransferase involved in cell wall biosynthesis